MKLDLDSQPMSLTCPGCSRKLQEKLGRLKRDPTVKCPGCQQPIKIEAASLRKGLASAQKSLDSLVAAVKRIGK